MKKFIDRFCKSLTARIFLITALILLAACGATYLFIAWATPISYQSVEADYLSERIDMLVNELQNTPKEDSGPLFDRFTRETGATITVTDLQDSTESTYFSYAVPGTSQGVDVAGAVSGSVAKGGVIGIFSTFDSMVLSSTDWDVTFTYGDDDRLYQLSVISSVTAVNQTVEAMQRVLPYLALAVLLISLLGAVFYSRYITQPIVRLSGISRKMAALDFTWECREKRRDEIGVLGQNLDELSRRLSASLAELQTANASLQQEIDHERELERQRTTFFAAASHELKTPVTVLKGQLSGMLAGVDVYRDRDKYLARSLAVTGRMEKLVQEILTISRMERAGAVIQTAPVNLSKLVSDQVMLTEDLAMQREQQVSASLMPDLTIQGDGALLSRTVSNLLANALNYSPQEAHVDVILSAGESGPVLVIENEYAHIVEEAIPHLFEAFYRVEASRSRETGGSGLGLYLVKMILDRHNASCTVENTENGVRVTVAFHRDARGQQLQEQ